MNNNRLVFFIGCSLLVLSMILLLTGSTIEIRPYILIGIALAIGGMINEALGE